MKKEYNIGKARVKLEVRKNTKREFLQSIFWNFYYRNIDLLLLL